MNFGVAMIWAVALCVLSLCASSGPEQQAGLQRNSHGAPPALAQVSGSDRTAATSQSTIRDNATAGHLKPLAEMLPGRPTGYEDVLTVPDAQARLRRAIALGDDSGVRWQLGRCRNVAVTEAELALAVVCRRGAVSVSGLRSMLQSGWEADALRQFPGGVRAIEGIVAAATTSMHCNGVAQSCATPAEPSSNFYIDQQLAQFAAEQLLYPVLDVLPGGGDEASSRMLRVVLDACRTQGVSVDGAWTMRYLVMGGRWADVRAMVNFGIVKSGALYTMARTLISDAHVSSDTVAHFIALCGREMCADMRSSDVCPDGFSAAGGALLAAALARGDAAGSGWRAGLALLDAGVVGPEGVAGVVVGEASVPPAAAARLLALGAVHACTDLAEVVRSLLVRPGGAARLAALVSDAHFVSQFGGHAALAVVGALDHGIALGRSGLIDAAVEVLRSTADSRAFVRRVCEQLVRADDRSDDRRWTRLSVWVNAVPVYAATYRKLCGHAVWSLALDHALDNV